MENPIKLILVQEGMPVIVTDFDGTEYSAVVDNLYPREEKPFVLVKFRDSAGNDRQLEFHYEGKAPGLRLEGG